MGDAISPVSEQLLSARPWFGAYDAGVPAEISIRGGGTMVLQPRFVLQDVLKGIHRERPPRDVEEPLYQHPKVKEAVAVGIPDARSGEAVKVYIVLRDGESATEQEIFDFCHTKMARYTVPKLVEF